MGGSCIPFYMHVFQYNIHRRNQGRLVRYVVLVVLWILAAVICQSLYSAIGDFFGAVFSVTTMALLASLFGWVAYRLIHFPPVADFLIDVQLESSKVSWSNWIELRRTTLIVLSAMVLFSAYLFACDVSWQFVLRSLSILNINV